jgi:RHS repeat-associated protein
VTASQFGGQPIFGFTAAEIDRETDLGLIRMGARWHAPRLGRWTSADPLFLQDPKEGLESSLELNLYTYAINNPVAFIDSNGLHVGIPIAKRSYDPDTDRKPGIGHDTYTVYKFRTYDFDTYKKYLEASPELRKARIVAEFELSFDVQLNNNPSILVEKQRPVELVAFKKQFGSPRTNGHQFKLKDFRSKGLRYGRMRPNGVRVNFSNVIQIHNGGPSWSKGCPVTPLKAYHGSVKPAGNGLKLIPENKLRFEESLYDAFALSPSDNRATLVLPGTDESYSTYEAEKFDDWSGVNTELDFGSE